MSHPLWLILASLLLTGLALARLTAKQQPPSGSPAHGLDLAGMVPSVKPGDDQYQAAARRLTRLRSRSPGVASPPA
jgi:hypothetical protein